MTAQPSILRRVFLNDEPRLRAGWRIALFVLTYVVAQILFATIFVGLAITLLPIEGVAGLPPQLIAGHVADFVALVVAVFIARGLYDKRRFETLGLEPRSPWLVDLAVGALVGLLLMSLIFLVHLAAGWLTIEGFGWQGPSAGMFLPVLLGFLVIFLLVGFKEELMVRGYLFQNIEDGLGTVWAVVLSSVVFGVIHLGNPDSSLIAAAGISIGGLLFAVAYLVTRALWYPIGLHFAWNFAEGPIFGFPVSGLASGGLIIHRVTGPEPITGGAFGPEAGLIVVAAALLGIGLTLLYGRWRAARYPASRKRPIG